MDLSVVAAFQQQLRLFILAGNLPVYLHEDQIATDGLNRPVASLDLDLGAWLIFLLHRLRNFLVDDAAVPAQDDGEVPSKSQTASLLFLFKLQVFVRLLENGNACLSLPYFFIIEQDVEDLLSDRLDAFEVFEEAVGVGKYLLYQLFLGFHQFFVGLLHL